MAPKLHVDLGDWTGADLGGVLRCSDGGEHIMSHRPVSMTLVGSRLGRRTLLEDLDCVEVASNIAELRRHGFDHIRVASCSSAELAAAVTPGAPDGPPLTAPFDTALICTDSIEHGVAPTKWLVKYQRAAGLESTRTILVSGAACANFARGLDLARSMIIAGDSETVLVVTTDRVLDGQRYEGAVNSVYSDGAAGCLVRAEPSARSFELEGSATEYRAVPLTETFAGTRSMLMSMNAAARRARVAAATDVRHVVTLNLSRPSRELLVSASTVSVDKMFTGPIADVGHCFAADILINLHELESGGLGDQDRVLALPSSRHALSALVLKYQR